MGTKPPPPKGHRLPIFGLCLLWPNGWMDEDATWYGDRPRSRRHCVRWGPSSPFQNRGTADPHFSAHVFCDQTTGWIKMPLGRKVGLDPSDTVLDGDPASHRPKKAAEPPSFGPYLLCPNGWMDEDATWYGGRPRPRPHCVRWGPSSPSPKRGHSPSPNFRPMSILATRLDGSRSVSYTHLTLPTNREV